MSSTSYDFFQECNILCIHKNEFHYENGVRVYQARNHDFLDLPILVYMAFCCTSTIFGPCANVASRMIFRVIVYCPRVSSHVFVPSPIQTQQTQLLYDARFETRNWSQPSSNSFDIFTLFQSKFKMLVVL